MITWPKPNQIGYDSNGFRQPLGEIFVDHYSRDQKALNTCIDEWREILNQISDMREQNNKSLKFKLRKGIPDCLRVKVWPKLIRKVKQLPPYDRILQESKFEHTQNINLDLGRTFPNNLHFKQNSQCYDSLSNILNAISVSFPEMGYCQGFNFIAATIILKCNDQQAYEILAHILENFKHKEILTQPKLVQINLYVFQCTHLLIQGLMNKYFNKLSMQLKDLGIQPYHYASGWFITLFCNYLPFGYNLRMMDSYLVEGQKLIYRVALQIMEYKQHKIKKMNDFSQVLTYLKNYDEFNNIDVNEFFIKMHKIKFTKKDIQVLKFQLKNI